MTQNNVHNERSESEQVRARRARAAMQLEEAERAMRAECRGELKRASKCVPDVDVDVSSVI